jgi:hypothetical protein
MNLLDIFEGREPHQQAIDKLEQARIDHLKEKMDYYAKHRMVKDFQKAKAEHDSYFKVQDECMGYGSLGEADQVPAPAQPVRAGTDLVTPQQRVAGATPPNNTALGKAKSTFSSFVDWLAGRDDTGPTYESTVKEQTSAVSPVTAAKYAYEQMRIAHDDNVDIATIKWMNNDQPITMSRNQLYHTLTRLKNMSRQNRNQFALQTLADRNNFALWLGGQKKVTTRPQLKQPADPFQPKLTGYAEPKLGPVSERAQKKNSEDPNFGDAETTNAVRKIQAKHPAAPNAIAALAKDELDHQKRSDQQLVAIQGANTKQDELLKKLVSLDQEQGREIDGLDSENNSLEAQLARIQATNDKLQTTIQSMTGTKQSARPKQVDKTQPQIKVTEPTPVPVASADPAIEKELQGLKTQISQLQAQRPSAEVKAEIAQLRNQYNSLAPAIAQATSGADSKKTPKVSAPFGDLDIKPPKTQTKPKTTTPKATPVPNPEDEFDLLNIDESANPLHPGDPIVVTAPNEFEGATGEIYEFSPSGTFVIVDLYNHGKHSMHLSDVEYNDYADKQEADDWHDEMDESAMSELDAMRQDAERLLPQQFKTMYGMWPEEFSFKYRTLLKPVAQQDVPVEEGYQDFNKVEPYAVCLAGKPVKQFDYYEEARRFHDNWKKKLYKSGKPDDKAKADKITLMPIMDEEFAGGARRSDAIKKQKVTINRPASSSDDQVKSFASQGYTIKFKPEVAEIYHGADLVYSKPGNYTNPTRAQLGIMRSRITDLVNKKAHKKPKNESDDFDDGDWDDMPDAHIAVKAKQPARYPEAVLRAIERNPNMRADIIRDYERKQGVAETVTDPRTGMAKIYRRLAPKIERHRDSFLAGQLYDELENYAELHGAETEFKRMMAGARNRAHMDYDTNPGGFQNWFWYLPFEDEVTEEFEMPGTTIPQKSIIRGYVVYYNPQTRMVSITRRGDSEEAAIEQARLGKPSIQSFETTVSKLINRLEQDLVEDENSTSSEAVEIALIRRILVAHTDLIMEFGLDKVTQAIEEVAYNVGDVDEIGSSDVSAYVDQVKQILGVPKELDEKWSQKYKSSINCANPKGFSQRAHCAGKKKK